VKALFIIALAFIFAAIKTLTVACVVYLAWNKVMAPTMDLIQIHFTQAIILAVAASVVGELFTRKETE
jgi:hypothetical protein